MRNLIIAGVALGSAVTVLVYERSALANTRQETRALAEKNLALEETLATERAGIAKLEGWVKARNDDLSRGRRELEAERAARQPVPDGRPDAATEGYWPASRPYFYLAKKHIPGLDYEPFSSRGGVSETAAAVFGITAGERRRIEGTMKSMFARLQQTELKSTTLTNPPPDLAGRPGAKISLLVPPNPEAAELRETTSAKITEILGGGERASLFLERAAEAAKHFESLATEERVVTLIPKEEHKGEIIITTQGRYSGSSFYQYDLAGEPDWIRTQYEHLLRAFLQEREER